MADSASDTGTSSIGPSADGVALKLVRFLERLSDSRGLLDYVASKQMGRHLAGAFRQRFGDQSLGEARQFATWMAGAVAVLEAEGDQS
jgi:hypothetical protein